MMAGKPTACFPPKPSLAGWLVQDRRPRHGGRIVLGLSRKKNESIAIGEDIVVAVVDIRHDKVRLGIEAPKEVSVHRREVYEAIKRSEGSTEGRREDCTFDM